MLYKIQKSDVNKAANVLSQSFLNYPIFKYILPDDQYRNRKLSCLFKFLIKNGMLAGEVITPSKNIECVSIWINSSQSSTSLMNAVESGIIGLFIKVDPASLKRFITIGRTKQKVRSSIINEPYCLLDVIGTDPKYQGKGFAKKIIQSQLTELDKQGLPCYLETSDSSNTEFYKRFGFNLFHQYELMDMKVYCFLRKCGESG
jgi:hypothetical protein